MLAGIALQAALGPTSGAPRQPDNPPPPLQPGATERPPTPQESMEAYLEVERWVRGWEVTASRTFEPATARVALYQKGTLLGAHTAMAAAQGESVLSPAAAGAMGSAEHSLLPRRDALWRDQMRLIAADLTISLELAGPMTPLSDADLARPDLAIRPGLDGLAVRLDDEWLLAFPSELAAVEATPGIELPAMAARLLGDPALGIELPADLAAEKGVVFYRFEVVHLAGVGPDQGPVFLTRGGRVVEQGQVTIAGLAAFAEAMLSHLEAVRLPPESDLGLMGTMHPARGIADPPVASPTQQALVCVALTNLAGTPQVAPAVRDRAATLARTLMGDLQRVSEHEIAPEDDGVAAAIAWVVLERLGAASDGSHDLRPLFDTCEAMMAAHAAAERAEAQASVSEAILAWALAERARALGVGRDVAERDLRRLYRSTEPGSLVGMMPWLGWAELALAPEGPVPAAAALRQIREQVWEHQLTAEDAGETERDLVGGVVFTEGFVALPSWSTARPVALCATMLGDPRLTTDEELPGEIVRLLGAMRFLEQLSAGDVECRFFPRPDLARGGIRAAAWDAEMPPEATAMAMLSVSEFLRSLASAEAAKTTPTR